MSSHTSDATTQEHEGAWRLVAPRAWPWTLLVADATLLGLTALATQRAGPALERPDVLVTYPLVVLAWLATRGVYSPRAWRSALDYVYAACAALTLAAMTLVTAATAQGFVNDVAPAISRMWLFGLLLVGGGHTLFHEKYPGAPEGGLRNNAYTNVMVAWICQTAGEVLKLLPATRRQALRRQTGLSDEEIATWQDMSRRLFVPFTPTAS